MQRERPLNTCRCNTDDNVHNVGNNELRPEVKLEFGADGVSFDAAFNWCKYTDTQWASLKPVRLPSTNDQHNLKEQRSQKTKEKKKNQNKIFTFVGWTIKHFNFKDKTTNKPKRKSINLKEK